MNTIYRTPFTKPIALMLLRRGLPRHYAMPIIRLQDGFFKSLTDQDEIFWCDWVDAMTACKIPAGPVIDVIIFGDNTMKVDKKHRRRKGWTRKLLAAGLNLCGIRKAA